MKKANLLIHSQSFSWGEMDLFDEIENFKIAFDKARDIKLDPSSRDNIFNSPETYLLENFESLCIWPQAKRLYPWLDQVHHQFISNHVLHMPLTPQYSSSLRSLDKEDNFKGGNNGLFSVGRCEDPNRNVFDEESWNKLHIGYLRNNPQYIDWSTNDYFPNSGYSNRSICKFVKHHFPEFKDDEKILRWFGEDLVRKIRSDIRGDLIHLAMSIAESNYYNFEKELSDSEKRRLPGSERRIYSINKKGRIQYISLDHENFLFEVCDQNGDHIGAINFLGSLKGGAKGDHSIQI